MNEIKRRQFIELLNQQGETQVSASSVKRLFLSMFPEPTIPVGEYNHELEDGADRLGVKVLDMASNEEIKQFDAWLHVEVANAWKNKTKIPSISVVVERIENMNLPERVKLILATNTTTFLMQMNTQFAEREQLQTISDTLKGVVDKVEAIGKLTKLKEQQENDNSKPRDK